MTPVRTFLGNPYPLGATWTGNGVNFALFSEHATSVELCLFDNVNTIEENVRIPLAEQTDQISPNYYSPQQLQLHQLGLDFEAPWGGEALKLKLRYLPGYGDESGARNDFVQVADVDLVWSWGKAFSLRPSFSFTSTPTYRSTSYTLALVSLF